MGKSAGTSNEGGNGCLRFKTLVVTAFSLTMFEGIAGLICSLMYLLYHNCTIKVKNDSEDNLLKVLYLKYVVGGDCTWKADGQVSDTAVGRYNPNNLTHPDNLVIWQIVYIALYILWVITASIITKSFKRPRSYLIPWLLSTGLIIIADLIFTGMALTDLGKEMDSDISTIFKDYQSESTVTLVLYCCKGGVFWLINVVLLVWILNSLIVYKGSSDNNSLWTDKNYDDFKNELSSHGVGEGRGYDDLKGTESEPEMVTEFREEESWEPNHGPATIQPSQHTHIPNRHTQNNGIRNGVPNGYGSGVPNGYSNGIPNGYGNGVPNSYGNGVPNGYSNGVPNGYGSGVPNGYSNGIPNGYGNGVPNNYSNGVPNNYSNGVANGNEGPKAYDNGGFQHEKPKSFKERIKETKDNKKNVGSGGVYAYISEPPVIPNYKKGVPVKDVDSAFGFLSNYDEKQTEGTGGQSNRSDASVTSSKIVNGRMVYDNDENGPFYIPKMKI